MKKEFCWHTALGSARFIRVGVLAVLWSLLTVTHALAQDRVPAISADSLARIKADSARRAAEVAERDSVFYTKLKTRMYKNRISRKLYDALFRDVYNSKIKTGEVDRIETNPFQPYEGRIIKKIYIRRLDVFGQSVYDTLRKARTIAERLGNRLHTDTREGIIRRSYLLFHEGDRVDPDTLRDNERLLRNSNIFHDARIIVIPQANNRQYVDVYVFTQDVWSLLPSGGFGGFNNFSLSLEQRNFRGLGHTFSNWVSYQSFAPYQKVEYRGRYVIPYIGRQFITGQADVLLLRDLKQYSAKVFRPFLTPDTRWAGSAEVSYYQFPRFRNFAENDSITLFPLHYFYNDVWAGHSFKPFFSFLGEGNDRSRLVLSTRFTRYSFTQRPGVINLDTNQLYQNSRTLLFSVGLSRRRYTRDVLIYAFGRTEDVPYGSLTSLTWGYNNTEFGPRTYIGVNYSRAIYTKNFGYLYGRVNTGTYLRANKGIEQGVFSLEGSYFSPLRTTSWGNWRHFINFRYVVGAQRFNNEYLTLSGREQIGINTDFLHGTKLFLGQVQNTLFSKLDVLGFRVAVLTFANLGLVSYSNKHLLRGPLYQGYGIGFRLRNENLTFNSFQIRLAWYPDIPGNRQPIRTAFEAVPTARFPDFAIQSPEVIPFR